MYCYKKTQEHTDQIKNKPQDLLVNTGSATRRIISKSNREENNNRVSTFKYF